MAYIVETALVSIQGRSYLVEGKYRIKIYSSIGREWSLIKKAQSHWQLGYSLFILLLQRIYFQKVGWRLYACHSAFFLPIRFGGSFCPHQIARRLV